MKLLHNLFILILIFKELKFLKLTRLQKSQLKQQQQNQQYDLQDLVDNYVKSKKIRFLQTDNYNSNQNEKLKQEKQNQMRKLQQVTQEQESFEKQLEPQQQQKLVEKLQEEQGNQSQTIEKQEIDPEQQQFNNLEMRDNNIFQESLIDRKRTIEKQTINKYEIGGEVQKEKEDEYKLDEREGDEMKVIKEGWLMVEPTFNLDETKKNVMVRDFLQKKYRQEDSQEEWQLNNRYQVNDTRVPFQQAFYFRLSLNNLYYTTERQDLVVLGAIAIYNLHELVNEQEYCFQVEDSEKDHWQLCSIHKLIQSNTPDSLGEQWPILDSDSKRSWMCAIWDVIGQHYHCQQPPAVVEEREIVKQPVMVLLENTPDCNSGWDYKQQGDDWECNCQDKLQSPIDLPPLGQCGKDDNLEYLQVSAVFRFHPVDYSQLQLQWKDNLLRVTTVATDTCVDTDTLPKVLLTVVDTDFNVYDFTQVVIHLTGEHTINGQTVSIEVQAIGQSQDQLQQMVVAWRGDLATTPSTTFFDTWDLMNLPDRNHVIKPFPTQQQQKDKEKEKKFDLKELMRPGNDDNYYDYYTYQGSLSYPPCSQAKWIVFIDTFSVGLTFIEMFKMTQFTQTLPQPVYYSSHRNIQDKEGRLIGIYINAEKKEVEDDLKGHFEKVEVESYKYFYQPGKLPSKFKGSEKVEFNSLFPKYKVSKPIQNLIKKTST